MSTSLSQESLLRVIARNETPYFHPRTGEHFPTCTDACTKMPAISHLHTNGCPRTTYHREVNRPQAVTSHGEFNGKPTGQLKTFWGERKHGYTSKHQNSKHGGNRFIPPVAPTKRHLSDTVRFVPQVIRQVSQVTVTM
jgi:hypothetical protein